MEKTHTGTRTTRAYLTSGEVARLLGVSSYWINILIGKDELDTHRMGDKGWHRVSVKSLEAYAQRHSIELDWGLLEPVAA